MESEKIAKDRYFYRKYASRIEWSRGFKALSAISFFLHELSYWDGGLEYVRIVENDLFQKGIIPFKVENVDDIYRIEHEDMPFEVRRLMWYIWYGVKQNMGNQADR